MRKFCFAIFPFFIFRSVLLAQPVPAEVENIPFIMTFGPKAEKSWGDDDYSQTFFFQIPDNYKSAVYIRIFDPDVGGEIDELNGIFDTQMAYSVYGGKGSYSDPDARETDPKGNYKSGILLASKKFGVDSKYDNNWFTFGPFNPTEGEHINDFGGCFIFKLICDGISGDDGNMYRLFLSSSPTENKPIEGGNAFAYEYSFRMWDNPNQISHIYPYVDDRTISVRLSNFDWDSDGLIRVVSVARQGQIFPVSDQGEWSTSEFTIKPEEKNTSLDIQFIKRKSPIVKNNNVVINVRNQYGELLRFYTAPIGGVPKYKYDFRINKVGE
jgi:hypothetical protein